MSADAIVNRYRNKPDRWCKPAYFVAFVFFVV
jgi:hypothetical protein